MRVKLRPGAFAAAIILNLWVWVLTGLTHNIPVMFLEQTIIVWRPVNSMGLGLIVLLLCYIVEGMAYWERNRANHRDYYNGPVIVRRLYSCPGLSLDPRSVYLLGPRHEDYRTQKMVRFDRGKRWIGRQGTEDE
jgi:hypothetical protein